MGVSSNNVRVTLARLVADSLVQSVGRGEYRLGAAGSALAAEVAGWRERLQSLKRWRGNYVVAACAGLGRGDRAAVNRRERALTLTGFRQLEGDLWLRPDNLVGGVQRVRERLERLQLSPGQASLEARPLVFRAAELADCDEARIAALWDVKRIERGYEETRTRLEQWLEGADRLTPQVAARQSFLLGDGAIRQWVFDPLLPEELIDGELRQKFVASVVRFDEAGQRIWRALSRTAEERTGSTGRAAALGGAA
ncbi:MAG: PaaX family transcriptional regulator [Polyangiaceae bacterium]|nr:PaaX family transcriptional regulator [Polyangiaceae bacterium]MCB9608894.1 PaaX family transcriptional regulator [Polyangiaceae bacterium]